MTHISPRYVQDVQAKFLKLIKDGVNEQFR